jgi:GNAT superfamily N-acetyltransferase
VTPPISVRVADDSDVDVLAELRRAWNEENADAAIDDESFAGAFRDWWRAEQSTRTFFLVEVDGRPVGMANVKHYTRMPVAGRASGGWWGYVGNVFVLGEHRNRGIGRVLMDAVIRWGGDAGAEHLRLAPSPLSKSFYARLGFEPGAVVEVDPPSPD